MADYSGPVEELAHQIATNRPRLDLSADYYEATYRLQAIGLAVPPEMRALTAHIGWPRMYLDSLEERLDIEGFRLGQDTGAVDRLSDWWQANSLDEESGLAHLDAFIYGRSYVTVAAPSDEDEPGVPVIRVESPVSMLAETDPRTRRVTRALRLYRSSDQTWATLYLPDRTVPMTLRRDRWEVDGPVVEHRLGIVPVVPLLNRERLSDRHGRSEITPEIRSLTDAASRIMMDMQAAAEIMAVPQRVLFGVEAEDVAGGGTPTEIMDAYLARILAFENEGGKAFQFTAAELRNFVEVLEQLAKHVASYTGLPPQYLAYNSDNPASAEAIRSSEARLVKKSERKARMFGGAWESVMRLAIRVIDGSVAPELNRLEVVWRDPSTPTFAAKADAVMKLYAGGTGIIPREQARIDMGYTLEQRDEMRRLDDADPLSRLNALVGSPADAQAADAGRFETAA
ncbi:hypothetical protein JOD54_002173 [Actinokineospora baliensis]|uniref:phage portal protein n=1 Tax=Actinokineospora baliensis TaxID=547056 RepID=UPI0019579B18|nr:phage portal protein [Actinokineospora baliensis]MBM7771969.1 hypothetical protein [Actinokineospora baliensis]